MARKIAPAEILDSLRNELGPRLQVVNKSNSGHGLACREGYELALSEGSPWIFQIDSDGQCDPVFFEITYRDRAAYDCIFGYRRTRDDGFCRVVVSLCCRLLLWLVNRYLFAGPERSLSAHAFECAEKSAAKGYGRF